MPRSCPSSDESSIAVNRAMYSDDEIARICGQVIDSGPDFAACWAAFFCAWVCASVEPPKTSSRVRSVAAYRMAEILLDEDDALQLASRRCTRQWGSAAGRLARSPQQRALEQMINGAFQMLAPRLRPLPRSAPHQELPAMSGRHFFERFSRFGMFGERGAQIGWDRHGS